MVTIRNVLKIEYTDDIHNALMLPKFWERNEPSEWTALNYFEVMHQINPTLSKRAASNYLSSDVALLKKHILPGTVAESALEEMDKWSESKMGKSIISNFYKELEGTIESRLKQKAAKAKLTATMMQEVAEDEEERVQKKRKTQIVIRPLSSVPPSSSPVSHDITAIASTRELTENGKDKRTSSVWKEWKPPQHTDP